MKNTKTKKHLLISAFLLSFFLLSQIILIQFSSPSPAQAASNLWQMQTGVNEVGQEAFGDSTPKYDIRVIVANVVKIFLGFLGIVFLVLLITAGYKYMMAGGDEEKIREAIGQIKNAVIGLIIIMASYAVADYITKCVIDVTNASPTWMCNRETY